MKKIIYTISFILLLSGHLFGQNKFINASLITTKNDTIKGQIYYEDWIVSPQYILFKEGVSEPQKVKATDAKGFVLLAQQQTFVSKHLVIKYVAKEVVNSHKDIFEESQTLDAFLKLITSSDKGVSLYEFTDNDEKVRFFVEKDNNLLELNNYVYLLKKADGKIYEVKNTQFIEQLKQLCDDKLPNLSVDYTELSLRKYVEQYNKSIGQESKQASLIQKRINSLGLGFGYENLRHAFGSNALSNAGFSVFFRQLQPKKHYNSFIRGEVCYVPQYLIVESQGTLKTNSVNFNFVFGSYFGNSKIYLPFYEVGAGLYKTFLGSNETILKQWGINVKSLSGPRSMYATLGAGFSFKKKWEFKINQLLYLDGGSSTNVKGLYFFYK
jgi:hypothetical protein